MRSAILRKLTAFALTTSLAVPSARAQAQVAGDEQEREDAENDDTAPHCARSGVQGVVRDVSTGDTLIEAPVSVVGSRARTLTDYEGRFAIELPPGTYSLRAHYDLYQPTRLDRVTVGPGQCTRVELTLAMETEAAEEVVIEVRATRGTVASQLRVRRESAASEDAISSEEIRRSPDSTASEAARRVVGVTVRDDYLFVRGLGGRYVTALMNGVALPQTDPDVPGVQLDLFPSGMLEGLTIRKTFTSDMPGDWAGGLLDISTASYPTRFELRAGVSFGVNTETSFQTVLGSQSSGLDVLGFDDGTRSLPDRARGVDVNMLSAEDRADLSTRFPSTWAMRNRTALPNLGLQFSLGDTIEVEGRRLGYRLLLGYRVGDRPIADLVQTLKEPTEGVPPSVRQTLRQTGSERFAQLGALGTLTFEVDPGHELTLNALFSQVGEDFTGRQQGSSESAGMALDAYRMSWLERTLFFAQLLGAHRNVFGAARIDWQLNTSFGERDQPDMRDMVYVQRPDGRFAYTAGQSSGSRFYSELEDVSYGAGLSTTVPISQVTLRAGTLFRQSERELAIRRFNWLTRPTAPSDGVYLPPSQLFSPENINTYLRINDNTSDTDGYGATQLLVAAYATAEWLPFPFLRVVAGIRGESFRQLVETRDPVGSDPSLLAVARTDLDPLPSGAVIAELSENVFLRASYGGTVGRPLVRELAPINFVDFVRRRNVTGNADLRRTYIHNVDLRLEWFPSAEDVLAVSLFTKVFESPIEPVLRSIEGSSSFANVDGAENYGAELEVRFGLGHLSPAVDWMTVGFNVALIESRVRLSEQQRVNATHAERPLAGQAPWVFNAVLGFAPPATNLSINVFYNVLGPRLEDVGLYPFPDVYRQPFHALDVTAAWEIVPGYSLRFIAQNLAFQRQDLTQADIVVFSIAPGTQFSLGFSVTN